MFESGNNLTLSDLIDIKLLQELQDNFSSAMNIASMTYDNEKPVTKPSNFNDFCIKYTRASVEGAKRCSDCDLKWANLAAKKGEPVIYKCHTGLTDFVVPIIVRGRHIGSIFAGQVLTGPPDEEHFRKVARELGINEDGYIDALRKIKIIPEENVKAAANLLYLVANAISEIGNNNSRLIQKNKKGKLYREIIDTIRSTLDIEETKNRIVNTIGKALNADRCFIAEYDKDNERFFIIKDEYLSSKDIIPYTGADANNDVPNFVQALKKGKYLLINNKEIFIDTENQYFEIEKQAIEKYKVNSVFSIPLFYSEEFLGVFAVHYVRKHYIGQEEIKFITNIAGQIAIALHQAKLYQALKQTTANQNAILNNIPFMAWLKDAKSRFLGGNYILAQICRTTIENLIGKSDFDFFPKEYAESYVNEDNLVMETKQTISSEDLIAGPEGDKWHETFKSPVFDDKGNVVGTVGISRDITERREAEVELLRRQEEIVKSNSREKLYRTIMEEIRSTLDIDKTKKAIVEIIGKILRADRCFIVEYDKAREKFSSVNYEYLSSDKVIGYKNLYPEKIFPNFAEALKNRQRILVKNKEIFIDNKKREFNIESKAILKYHTVSAFVIPIFYNEDFLGSLSIHYTTGENEVTDEDIVFVTGIADQIAVAIHQAKLYKLTQVQAEREKLTRNTIETVRSSIDLDLVKHKMVVQLGSFLKADRVAFVDYDFEKGNYFVLPESEYRSSSKVKTFIGYDFVSIPGFIESIREVHLKGKDIIFSDLDKYLEQNNLKETPIEDFYKYMGFISSMAININHGDEFYGNLVITFNKKRDITEDDIRVIRTIADQAGIAIYQSSLYKKEKQTAEREKLYRTITETIRSTLDIDETKKRIVEIIGRTLKADRCFVTEIDKSNGRFLPIKYEYLSSDKVISYQGFDPNISAPHYIEILRKGEPLLIKNKQIIVNSENMHFELEEEMIEKYKTNSSFASPIFYNEEFLGSLSIHYVTSEHQITEDDISFITGLTDQIAVALHQAELYKITKVNAEREKLIGNVVSKIISTFEINEIKHIVKDIGVITKADRCYFVEVDLDNKKGKPINYEGEYLASPDIKSIIGYKFPIEDVERFVEAYLNVKDLMFFDYDKARHDESGAYAGIKRYGDQFDLQSGIGIPFIYRDKLLAVLAIEYVKEKVFPADDEINFLRILGNQIGMAFNQIQLYQSTKKVAQRESILRKVIEAVRSSLDLKEVKKNVIEEICKEFNADRCYFRSYDKAKDLILPPDVEYLASPDIGSLMNVEVDQYSLKYFMDEVKRQKKGFYPIVVDEKFAKGTPLEAYISSVGIKVDYAIPIIDRQDELTWLVIHYAKEDPKLDEDSKRLLETIAYQIDMGFEQIRLFDTVKHTAERESLLRQIFEAMRSSLDINVIKSKIVDAVGKALNVDICFILTYDKSNDYFFVDKYSEYKLSPEAKSYIDFDTNDLKVKFFVDSFKNNQEVSFAKVEDLIIDKNLQGTPEEGFLKEYNIKSAYNISMYYANSLLGFIILQYTKDYRSFTESELEFIRLVATQAGTAIYQANLYKITQIQADRERISKNIIEILRSTMDKSIIKHLFVQNIGKYFKADRVFYSDYDPETNMYLPVDEHSEYLSSSLVKSFVGYDWSDPSIREYIQPLLDKRELNIFCWDEYIKNNPKSQDFVSLFEDSNVKSSYNIPVLYQERIMGYFCIEFTQESCNHLSTEDIRRIRSICSQAGIALYHAELYVQAQESARLKGELIKTISNELKVSLENIIKTFETLSQVEVNPKEWIEYINKKREELAELKNDIISVSQIESENFKLTYEYVNSESLIMEVLNSVKSIVIDKNINIETYLIKASVKADKERFAQIFYQLLNTVLKLTSSNSHIIIKTELDGSKLVTSIEDSGVGVDVATQNLIFETFKQIDFCYVGLRKNIGLGLSMTKRLIELHNGAMYVDSTDDRGSRIWFVLPNAHMLE